ncbi:MAG: MBOAT family O-acyltransferase [Anaerovoracaceae bacterium]|jgi:alginate O-acetyltransferase complex protein AlgI
MSYTSLAFIPFILISIAGYFLVPKEYRWIMLLVSSYIFYMFSGFKQIAFLLLTTLTTFVAALLLEKCNGRMDLTMEKEERKRLQRIVKRDKKLIVFICLMLDFGILAFLKYYNFVAESINDLLRISVDGGALPIYNLLLPLGISFYTFQSAGYVIDVYRGKYKADRHIGKFALFVSFFPQLIQGPIGRHDRLAHQLYAPNQWDSTRAKYGIQRMLWGYFKKMVIADRAAVLVGTVFSGYEDYGGAVIFTSVLFYSVLIYCDFSGGIDISLGIAQILGIYMDENFRRPFFATSIADFWRRWHITLGTWLKDYLFYPITLSKTMGTFGRACRQKFGNERGKIIPVSLATFLVYIVVGLWHGASWKYIAFGLYSGSIITFSLVFENRYLVIKQKLGIKDGKAWHIFSVFRTLFLVCIGRYFSRADSFMSAIHMLRRTFFHFEPMEMFNGTLLQLGLTFNDFIIIIAGSMVLFTSDYLAEKGVDIKRNLETKPFLLQWAVMVAALCAILFLGIYSEGYTGVEFIYAQF